jgi:hypothetical protein
MALALVVFGGETALHSAHHVNDPGQAEQCLVYSASLHVTGLEAGLATPQLPLPMPNAERLHACDASWFARVVDEQHSRAPPFLSA